MQGCLASRGDSRSQPQTAHGTWILARRQGAEPTVVTHIGTLASGSADLSSRDARGGDTEGMVAVRQPLITETSGQGHSLEGAGDL